MLKAIVACTALLLGTAAVTAPTYAGGGGGGSTSTRSEIRLEARMRAGATEAKVAWRQETRGTTVRRKLQAEVYRGKPNTTYTVTHKGTEVAKITTDKFGNGRVEFERTSLVMNAGDSVMVGSLKGTLARR